MNILSIAPTPFFADRGCHVRILEESRALAKLGDKITICTYHIGRNVDNFEIKRIPNIPWYNKLEAGPSYHMFYLDTLLLLNSMYTSLKIKPDVVHAHLHEGAFIGKFSSKFNNIPMVFDVQGSLVGEMLSHGFLKKNSTSCKLIHELEKIINKSANALITSSSNMAEILKNDFQLDKDKIFVVQDGVDTDIFNPDYDTQELRKKFGIMDDCKVVVFLGLLNAYQGIDILINSIPHVIKSVDKVCFLIMGYPDTEKYHEMAINSNVEDHIIFTGKINYLEAPLYLNLGDIAVSPKITSSGEGNGKVYNYMACGLPTVVFDFPTNREILGETGIYVKSLTPEALAEGIVELLLDNKKIEKLSAEVRKKAVDDYSWISAGKKIQKIYHEISKK